MRQGRAETVRFRQERGPGNDDATFASCDNLKMLEREASNITEATKFFTVILTTERSARHPQSNTNCDCMRAGPAFP